GTRACTSKSSSRATRAERSPRSRGCSVWARGWRSSTSWPSRVSYLNPRRLGPPCPPGPLPYRSVKRELTLHGRPLERFPLEDPPQAVEAPARPRQPAAVALAPRLPAWHEGDRKSVV